MPFITDETWTPSAHRKAYALWAANAPKTDAPIIPRNAHTASPRHGKLSGKLRGLLTWKAATNPEPPLTTSWMRYDLPADNDNEFDGTEPVPALLDSETEIRPSIGELRREWENRKDSETKVEYRNGVAVGGDIAHAVVSGPAYAVAEGESAPRRQYRIVTRIRRLEFGNGQQEEHCIVLRNDKPAKGRARVPEGALVRFRGRKPVDNFRSAKGSLPDTDYTVGIGSHNPGSIRCPDPVVDHEWATTLRRHVGKEAAKVLDLAIVAANFREVGEAFGKTGKNAERHGKTAVIAACSRLDQVLAANDNFQKAA
ncbi:MAG: hypothetical protein EOQ52_12765 [Mesorhizobium sp.]|uniref:hypothetical protein n=1 Tax=Mesorhizobium sp. TaxID=1871066 RepID=UPI000FE4AC9D|nr:hypothetical protein [Mesorhizobium sp.]RWB89241.1 MAG: hypothetical protein EOQ52_12765 [Mesorhizobium sp.]